MALMGPSAAPAINFGSEPGGPYLIADSSWSVAARSLTSTAYSNAFATLFGDFNPTDLSVTYTEEQSSCLLAYDTCVYDGDYGETPWWGLFTCEGEASGAHPNRACYTGYVRLNYNNDPSGVARSEYNICHELGHAVGLQHTSSDTSCLKIYIDGGRDPDLNDHDVGKIDVQYK